LIDLKKRGSTKLIVLFFAVALILASAGIFLFFGGNSQTNPLIENSISSFKVDQLLIKALIKEDERLTRQINIMGISEQELFIELKVQNLPDIASVSENAFNLNPGQTKTVDLDLKSSIKEKNVEYKPGIYVGNLLVKSSSDTVKTPVIVEIETKDVLFDINANLGIAQKQIKQGESLNAQITVFNLKKIGLTNLDIEYFVKDISGNTIIIETEAITVETQTSFVKNIGTKGLNDGEYVFGAIVRYGSSVGTSTFLFKIGKSEERILLKNLRSNALFWILISASVIILFIIGSYASFLTGLLVHHKIVHPVKDKVKEKLQKKKDEVKGTKLKVEMGLGVKKEEKKLVKKKAKPEAEFRHKKLILWLIILSVIIVIIAYLSYTKVITLEKLISLWGLIAAWFRDLWGNILPYTRNLWKSILYYMSPKRSYFYPALVSIISLIAVICFIITARKTHFFRRLKSRLKERRARKVKGTKLKVEMGLGVKKEEKKLVLILIFLIIISFIIAYLFYSRIITLGKLDYLWNLIITWLKDITEKVLSFIKVFWKDILVSIKNLWKNTLYYTSSQRRYFYHVSWVIIGLIALICFIIMAKKMHLFSKLKQWLKKRNAKKLKEKRILRSKILLKQNSLFENIKRFPLREKIIILIMVVLLFLMVIFYVLYDLGILF